MHGIYIPIQTAILCLAILNTTASTPRNRITDLDDRSFIINVTTQITDELAKVEAKEKLALDTWAKQKEQAEGNLKKLRTEKEAAESLLLAKEQRLKGAQEQYDAIRLGTHTGGGDLRVAAREVAKASTEREQAQKTLESLAKAEDLYQRRAQEAEANLKGAASVFVRNTTRRAEQKAKLQRLSEEWQTNPTEENLIAVTDQITAISCEQNISANPFWKTTPGLGANIYYQSLGERKRGSRPNPINNPTQTQQPICLGEYYIWAERGGKATSDKDKRFTIYLGISEIIVVEDH